MINTKKQLRAELRAQKPLSDTKISQITSISIQTLAQWKKQERTSYRYKLYKLLKSMNEAELSAHFS